MPEADSEPEPETETETESESESESDADADADADAEVERGGLSASGGAVYAVEHHLLAIAQHGDLHLLPGLGRT